MNFSQNPRGPHDDNGLCFYFDRGIHSRDQHFHLQGQEYSIAYFYDAVKRPEALSLDGHSIMACRELR